MYLKQIRLWNFRKYGQSNILDLNASHLDLSFKKGLNVLIGENDSGKTAIIDAVKIVLRTHSGEWIGIDESDFYNGTSKLRIELMFEDLSDPEASHFPEGLSWTNSNPSLPFLIVSVNAELHNGKVLPYDIKAGKGEDAVVLTALPRDFLKTTYLRPLRDARSELIPRRNSRLSQILKAHPAFKASNNQHHLLNEFSRFNRSVAKYFEGKAEDNSEIADKNGKELKDKIDQYLFDFSGRKSLFEISQGEIKHILEKLELTFFDGINLGLGSHNLLFIAAELLHLNRSDWTGLRLGLIEEVEAHLHPQAQIKIINSLQANNSIQLIITTHSPNIGSQINLERLIICAGNQAFPMGKDYTLLEETDYTFLSRFLDVTKSNLFFAKGVLLVEGWSEELLLPTIAKLIGLSLADKGVSIVNVSNTAFLRYSKIFRRRDSGIFPIPVAVITDLDVRPSEEGVIVANGISKLEKKKSEKETKFNGGSVRTFVSPHWTFEYCIGLSSLLRKKLFEAIVQAGQEMEDDGYSGKSVNVTWTDFINGKDDENIALTMYSDFIGDGKNISKPIIAQKLAAILMNLPADQFQDLPQDENMNYIISAIRYACGGN